jgi:bacterial/archaeal transporter family-2 protein
MSYAAGLVAVLVGAGLTIQVGVNALAGQRLGSPLLASALNFAVGLLALVAVAVASGARLQASSLSNLPPWLWIGGLLGAAYVAATTVLGPRLGAAAVLALTLAGQLAAASVVDHYGAIGFPQHAFTWQRAVGIALLAAGTLLIVRR